MTLWTFLLWLLGQDGYEGSWKKDRVQFALNELCIKLTTMYFTPDKSYGHINQEKKVYKKNRQKKLIT